jgi:tetratricopeptide (TPR) repeat protein
MERCRQLDSAGSSRGQFALKPAPSFTGYCSAALTSLLSRHRQVPNGSSYRVTKQMLKDPACQRLARRPRKILSVGIAIALLGSCLRLAAQTGSAEIPSVEEVRQLAAEHRWQDIALRLGPLQSRSPDLNFYYSTALARLERWQEAENAFRVGLRLAPNDPRFPIELAGVAFKLKRYPEATHYLRRAVSLAPHDSYANDFLGTVYFLQGNLEAALKYWNRVGKPQTVEVRADPAPKVAPALLDRAFAFSPASTLQLSDFLTTEMRIRGLEIFSRHQFDLRTRDDDKFDVWFRNQERNGFGRTKWEALLLLFRGLPFLSVTPELYNFHHEAINFVSLIRLDPQKRRVFAQFSSPFERSAKYHYEVVADLRNENWGLRNSFTGPAPTLASLNLRREALDFSFDSFASGRWRWSASAEISHRDFRSFLPGTVLTPQLVAKGYQLKQSLQLNTLLWHLPERRFTVEGGVSSQVARLWSQPEESSEKLQGSLEWRWFPRSEGDDYETRQQLRAGKTFGTVPFDELFMLGLERDNDLPLRAHIGTRDGRKGSAPLGRDYFLSTWEADKNIYGNGVLTLKLGPFFDIGKITDSSSSLGSHEWLWDIGAQAKLRVFGTGVVFSYGKDLRSGNNSFYLAMLR